MGYTHYGENRPWLCSSYTILEEEFLITVTIVEISGIMLFSFVWISDSLKKL
jgi:hypothetical protein